MISYGLIPGIILLILSIISFFPDDYHFIFHIVSYDIHSTFEMLCFTSFTLVFIYNNYQPLAANSRYV